MGIAVGVISQALSFAPGNAPSVALLMVLPLLSVLYLRYLITGSKLQPNLSLRPLESIELQRTVLLYEKATRHIKDLCSQDSAEGRPWFVWNRGRKNLEPQLREELEDLNFYARDLRSTIIRLRGRPLARYKSWAHRASLKSALGRSLGFYSVCLLLLLAAFCYFEPILWAGGIELRFKAFVLWQAVKGRMLLANWMAVSFVSVALPLLYVLRRVALYRAHRPQVLDLKAFAAADPDRLAGGRDDNAETAKEDPEASREAVDDLDWLSVLGVSPSATIEDVKQAYKGLVKKSHPDRVQDMSESFVRLAEAETKKLNAAYEHALIYFRQGSPA